MSNIGPISLSLSLSPSAISDLMHMPRDWSLCSRLHPPEHTLLLITKHTLWFYGNQFILCRSVFIISIHNCSCDHLAKVNGVKLSFHRLHCCCYSYCCRITSLYVMHACIRTISVWHADTFIALNGYRCENLFVKNGLSQRSYE